VETDQRETIATIEGAGQRRREWDKVNVETLRNDLALRRTAVHLVESRVKPMKQRMSRYARYLTKNVDRASRV
jgi:hypothetical protein